MNFLLGNGSIYQSEYDPSQNSTNYDFLFTDQNGFYLPTVDANGIAYQSPWLSNRGGEDNSSYGCDLVPPSLMVQNEQLVPLDHQGTSPNVDQGVDMQQVPDGSSNLLPTSNIPGYSVGDVFQPLNVPMDSWDNVFSTWNAFEGSTDNVLSMLPFSGQMDHTQVYTGLVQNCSKATNYLPPCTRISWTPQEDQLLRELVGLYGERRWSFLAKQFPNRNGKQLRERWRNHVRPDIKGDEWTEEEDAFLIKVHKEIGSQWAKISRLLPGRTENAVKNHWNTNLRKNSSKRNNNNGKGKGILQQYIASLPKKVNKKNSTKDLVVPEVPSQSVENMNPTNHHPVPGDHNNTAVVNGAKQFDGFNFPCSSAFPEFMPSPGHEFCYDLDGSFYNDGQSISSENNW